MRALAAWLLVALLAMPVAALAQPAGADAATLADLRAQVAQVRGALQSLRAELVASGQAGFQAAGGAGAIDRMNAMEAQLMRLTDQTEQLQNRVNGISSDAERRLADLEFRLCEMDQGCDLSALTVPQAPAGAAPELAPSAPAMPADTGRPAASAAERADFDAALAAMDGGDHARAAQMFAEAAQTHAGGPLTAEALFMRGQALDRAGDPRAAAAAWLEGFAADPDGTRAGANLLGIARVIEGQGDATAACLYLAEIPARFPGTPEADQAQASVTRLGCGTADLGALDPLLDPSLDPEAVSDMAEHP